MEGANKENMQIHGQDTPRDTMVQSDPSCFDMNIQAKSFNRHGMVLEILKTHSTGTRVASG